MIYLFTALYCEAYIFIKQFHLEKNLENTRFQEFYNELAGIRLTITGIGEIAAATAVGSVCAEYKPKEGDILLNVGTCAHIAGSDGIFLCNKIVEQGTGKIFYPDILYCHHFQEEAIVTGMLPWDQEEAVGTEWLSRKDTTDRVGLPAKISGRALYDMEAAAIYQAGSYFFGPHQMVFLKIVSDGGTAKEVSQKQVEYLMEHYQDLLFDWIGQFQRIAQGNIQKEKCIQQEALIGQLSMDLHCSKVMRDSLRQHIHYLALAGIDYVSVIQEMYREELLPCKDKREGKLRFEELKRRLF